MKDRGKKKKAEEREKNRTAIKELLLELRLRRDQLLVARKTPTGVLATGEDWKFSKKGPGIFQWEGKDFSFLVTTEPYLQKNRQKWIGHLRAREVDLSYFINKVSDPEPKESRGQLKTTELTSCLETRELSPYYREVLGGLFDGEEGRSVPGWREILNWPPPRVSRFFSKLPLHIMAHSMIFLEDDYATWVLENRSDRYHLLLREELDFLRTYQIRDRRGRLIQEPFHGKYPLEEYSSAMGIFWETFLRA